jgi:hypothetical protein
MYDKARLPHQQASPGRRRPRHTRKENFSTGIFSVALVVASASLSHAWSSTSSISEKPRPPLHLDYRSFASPSDRQNILGLSMSIDIQMQQQSFPTMFLNHRFSSAASLSASPPAQRRVVDSTTRENWLQVQHRQPQSLDCRERRVLGFDVFSLDATRSKVDLDSWKSADLYNESHGEASFFPAPGLAWNSNSPTIKAAARSLRLLPNTLPAWFPWIPTKSQIEFLKVNELKEACAQRGLARVSFDHFRSRHVSTMCQHANCSSILILLANLLFDELANQDWKQGYIARTTGAMDGRATTAASSQNNWRFSRQFL